MSTTRIGQVLSVLENTKSAHFMIAGSTALKKYGLIKREPNNIDIIVSSDEDQSGIISILKDNKILSSGSFGLESGILRDNNGGRINFVDKMTSNDGLIINFIKLTGRYYNPMHTKYIDIKDAKEQKINLVSSPNAIDIDLEDLSNIIGVEMGLIREYREKLLRVRSAGLEGEGALIELLEGVISPIAIKAIQIYDAESSDLIRLLKEKFFPEEMAQDIVYLFKKTGKFGLTF